jgi:hypothetical protein
MLYLIQLLSPCDVRVYPLHLLIILAMSHTQNDTATTEKKEEEIFDCTTWKAKLLLTLSAIKADL